MKTISKLLPAILLACVMAVPSKGKAQVSLDSYYNIDWQFNIPLGNDFANDVSGWGMNFEGGYYVTPQIALGAFLNFHTNNEYFSRRTLHLTNTLSLNTDQQHQMFTLPFGVLMHYRFIEADFQPYAAMKLGMCYSEFNNYYYIFLRSQDRWGFYMSPEIGFNWYPWPNSIGFHFAFYYSFATNKCNIMTYSQDIINCLGFRLGLAF